MSWSTKIQKLLEGYHLIGFHDGATTCPTDEHSDEYHPIGFLAWRSSIMNIGYLRTNEATTMKSHKLSSGWVKGKNRDLNKEWETR